MQEKTVWASSRNAEGSQRSPSSGVVQGKRGERRSSTFGGTPFPQMISVQGNGDKLYEIW